MLDFKMSLLLTQIYFTGEHPKPKLVIFMGCQIKTNEPIRFIIGRNSQCDFQVNKSEVSRKQLSVEYSKRGEWVIRDLHSTNGSWIKCEKALFPIKNFTTVA